MKRACLSILSCCAFAGPSVAQIGSGWTEYFPTKTIQERGSTAKYAIADGVETFVIHGSDERCEVRFHDDYTSGVTQFQGEFFMVRHEGDTDGEDVCIAQVWLSMIVSLSAVNGGSLYQHTNDPFVGGMMGKWVRMNIYHSADANQGEVWINNKKLWSGATKDSNPFYHKYGLYNEARNNPMIMWRGPRFWRGGTTVGANPDPWDPASIHPPTLQPVRQGAEGARLSLFALDGRVLTELAQGIFLFTDGKGKLRKKITGILP